MTSLEYKILIVLLAPVAGALLIGIDRKITARIQGRIGPPILQPFYDVIKLLCKEPMVLNRVQVVYACFHLTFMLLVVVLLVMGQDMLMILFAHAFSTLALILGGMCVRSPYSRIGSQRKIMQMLAYEPVLILTVIGFYLSSNPHSFMASSVFAALRNPSAAQPLLLSLPLVFVAFFIATIIKLEKSPFDVASSHHAHQELIKGVTLEYSGPYLAIIEITHFCETFILFAILAMFWATNLWIGAALATACFLAQIIIDNAFARLTYMWMVRFMWAGPLLLALTNIIWLYMAE